MCRSIARWPPHSSSSVIPACLVPSSSRLSRLEGPRTPAPSESARISRKAAGVQPPVEEITQAAPTNTTDQQRPRQFHGQSPLAASRCSRRFPRRRVGRCLQVYSFVSVRSPMRYSAPCQYAHSQLNRGARRAARLNGGAAADRQSRPRIRRRRAGLPGKLTMIVLPRIPAAARERIAPRRFLRTRGAHTLGKSRESARSTTASVASGVTSRGPRPVPPVVRRMSRRLESATSFRNASMHGRSSASTADAMDGPTEFLAAARPPSHRNGLRLLPAATESLMVRMETRMGLVARGAQRSASSTLSSSTVALRLHRSGATPPSGGRSWCA